MPEKSTSLLPSINRVTFCILCGYKSHASGLMLRECEYNFGTHLLIPYNGQIAVYNIIQKLTVAYAYPKR